MLTGALWLGCQSEGPLSGHLASEVVKGKSAWVMDTCYGIWASPVGTWEALKGSEHNGDGIGLVGDMRQLSKLHLCDVISGCWEEFPSLFYDFSYIWLSYLHASTSTRHQTLLS